MRTVGCGQGCSGRRGRRGGTAGHRWFDGLAQIGPRRANGPGQLEARFHLARAGPGAVVQRVAVGRLAAVQRLAQAVQPAQRGRGVEDRRVAITQAQCRHHVAHRILELAAGAALELIGSEQRAQRGGDVAIAALEGLRHAVDQRTRRVVRQPVVGQLAADEARGGGCAGQAVQRLVHLGHALAVHGLAQELLGPEVVSARVEFKQALAHVQRLLRRWQARRVAAQLGLHAHAGQHPGELLHVALRVARVHAQGVQLHQLARVVFIDAARSVLGVVQKLQHGRVAHHGPQQIAETPQRMRADGAVFVVAQHGADFALALEHAEVVQPEPGHLLLHLAGRIHGAQQVALGGLARQPVHLLLPGVARGLLGRIVRQRIGGLALLHHVGHQFGGGALRDRHRADLRLHRAGQRGRRRRRAKLRVQPSLG